MITTTYSPKFLQQRKMLLYLPAMALPFIIGLFYALGGGQGPANNGAKTAASMGFNTELPKPVFNPKEGSMDKMAYYKKADEDSIRRRAYWMQDPYHKSSISASPALPDALPPIPLIHPVGLQGLKGPNSPEETKADELLKRLEGLKKSMERAPAIGSPRSLPAAEPPVSPLRGIRRPADTVERDPQLDRLNQMLDKIIQIQHPAHDSVPIVTALNASPAPANPAVKGILAIVEGNQKLVAGATIALRLTDSALISGVPMSHGQLLYGVVSFHNDRMGIHVGSIRSNQTIYTVSLEVYDMDGLAGIHILHMSGRQMAKESADQGISSLNLATYDPSVSGQATNAGIQIMRSLFRRRVRQEKVQVKAGYPVLLMNTKGR
jgi:hypothetical protein